MGAADSDASGNIVRDEQMGKGWDLLSPGEFFQHAPQVIT